MHLNLCINLELLDFSLELSIIFIGLQNCQLLIYLCDLSNKSWAFFLLILKLVSKSLNLFLHLQISFVHLTTKGLCFNQKFAGSLFNRRVISLLKFGDENYGLWSKIYISCLYLLISDIWRCFYWDFGRFMCFCLWIIMVLVLLFLLIIQNLICDFRHLSIMQFNSIFQVKFECFDFMLARLSNLFELFIEITHQLLISSLEFLNLSVLNDSWLLFFLLVEFIS